MFLSRFWYLVLAAIAGAAVAAYLIAVGQYNLARGQDLEALLIKDRVQVEALLKLDARSRIDALQGIAADETVRGAMAAVHQSRSESAGQSARQALQPKLRALNEGLAEVKGDFLAALDDRGRAVAQVGLWENAQGMGYGQFPLVQAALRGYLRDDVWRLDDKLYRVAARPIIQGGLYVGAILHGMELSSALPERLYRVARVQVAFFLGSALVASHQAQDAPSPSAGELAAPLGQVLRAEHFRREGRTDIVAVGQGYSGIYSRLTGEAAESDAGYVVTRPRVAIADPLGFALGASSEAAASVPWPVLAALVVVAFLIGLALVWLERDRPLSNLRKGLAALQGRVGDRIDVTRLGGPYRRVAIAVNEAMDRAVEAALSTAAPPVRREADLDAILGPTPGKAGAGSPFPFPGMDDGASLVPPAPPPSPVAGTKPAAGGKAMASGKPAAAVGPSAIPAPAVPAPAPGPVAAASFVPPAPPASAKLPVPPVPAPRPAASVAPAPGTPAGGSKPTMVGMSPSPIIAPVARGSEDEDMATVVAKVPDDLLAAAGAGVAGEDGGPTEEDHFRRVFEEFVQTKRKCGESVDALTFEKFLVTLRKNKETLVQRYHCKSVRFQVYVKDGKAALKATPVKG